mgnify:CR=1 FL=1
MALFFQWLHFVGVIIYMGTFQFNLFQARTQFALGVARFRVTGAWPPLPRPTFPNSTAGKAGACTLVFDVTWGLLEQSILPLPTFPNSTAGKADETGLVFDVTWGLLEQTSVLASVPFI